MPVLYRCHRRIKSYDLFLISNPISNFLNRFEVLPRIYSKYMNLANQDFSSPGDTSLFLILLRMLVKIIMLPQLTFTYLKSTMQTPEQCLKSTQS